MIKRTGDPHRDEITAISEAAYAALKHHPSSGPPLLAASSNAIYYSGAVSRDASALPCTGVRSTFDVVNQSSTGSGLFAVWNAIELSNGYWAQTGYWTEAGSVTGFYEVWDLPSTELTGGSWSISTGSHQFTIVYSGSGNIWDFYLDSALKGSYNMGTNVSAGTGASQPMEALVEQQLLGGAAFSVPNIEFTTAFQSQQGGNWVSVLQATADQVSGAPYYVQGKDQNASLAANAIIVGSAIPVISSGTVLWSSSSPITSNSFVILVVN